jgi:signal transduction histidine kinase
MRERQFTSDASHELRTPLAAIRGTLEVLVRRPRNPEEYVDKIELSLKEIDRVVETLGQLFLLAKMDSSTLNIEDSKISLSELINDTLIHYSADIEKQRLSVNLHSSLGLNDFVPRYYSNLIIDTIISNAIKYGKKGTVLDINIDAENGQIKCVITNQGMGIKSEDLKKVFHRFYRSNPLNHKHILGDGLGLSIAKKSAEAIGAEIHVKSELNMGTSFTILF